MQLHIYTDPEIYHEAKLNDLLPVIMTDAEVYNWNINRKGTIGWLSELYLNQIDSVIIQLLTKKQRRSSKSQKCL